MVGLCQFIRAFYRSRYVSWPHQQRHASSIYVRQRKIPQQNAKAVFESLEASGIQGLGEFQCKSKAKSEYRNLKEIKQRGIPQSS